MDAKKSNFAWAAPATSVHLQPPILAVSTPQYSITKGGGGQKILRDRLYNRKYLSLKMTSFCGRFSAKKNQILKRPPERLPYRFDPRLCRC